jgi:RsiW-degrading membrane proteinase PrsW (M82 family)
LNSVVICLSAGGVLGLIVAGVVEYQTLQGLSLISLFGVGVIEEAAKLVVPIIFFLRWDYRSEIDGLLFGVASGMGFAALETMGYGLVTLIQSQGSLDAMVQILVVRGFLSPAGHAAWTGMVCAVMWRERVRTGKRVPGVHVVMSFLLVVLLHTAWNALNSFETLTLGQFAAVIAGNILVAGASVLLLVRRLRESK